MGGFSKRRGILQMLPVPAEKFMPPPVRKTEALPWLKDLPQDNAAAWIKALRETGADAFASVGLPMRTLEGWQHTNLRPLSQRTFHYSSGPVTCDAQKIPEPLLKNTLRIVVVNGQFQPQLSTLCPGLKVMSLMDAVEKKMEGLEQWLVSVGNLSKEPLKALNTAYLRDGFVLDAGGDIAAPVEVIFYNTDNDNTSPAIYPRMLYRLGKNAGLTILEHHCGEGVYLANSVSEIVLEQDSRLKFYRVMQESMTAHHFSHAVVHQQKGSDFEGFSLALGGQVSRQEFQLELIDPTISACINGIYMLKDKQNHDFTIQVDHFEPDGESKQYFKGVVDDQARAVFQGKIHVRRSAQKTNGYQSHHALLLSREAEASAKPELEIYADDVKCSHGATSGHLDPVALFYLQSRGIPLDQARGLLIESFLNEAVDKVTFLPVQDICREEISKWLKERKA
jgi:Fe-S cluster assembly protein SufD